MSNKPLADVDDTPSIARKGIANEQSGYSPIFGLGDGKKDPLPRWLPVSLLALTTAALAVPIVLLRRQRAAAALQKSVGGAPPPPRRTGSGGASSIPPPSPRRAVSTYSAPPPRFASSGQTPLPRAPAKASSASVAPTAAPQSATSPAVASTVAGDGFNGAFYSAKAFGIATLLVGAGAVTTVWGVKQVLGVQNTQEFAHRMRHFILHQMPFLSSRIHRPPNPENSGDDPSAPQSYMDQGRVPVEWSWSDAEHRLKTAYEEDGIMGWAEAALRELEAEGELERSRRGHA